jgi:hypothetical protein
MLATALAFVQTAAAQSGPTASKLYQSESNSQFSNMGPATGNTEAGNNGVGTQSPLDSNPGKAGSTVAGVNGGSTGYGGGTSSKGTGTVESDPTQEGSKKPQ